MKKGKTISYFVILVLTYLLSACTQNPDFKLYEGKSLRIAVVGKLPEVKEEQVMFDEVSFNDITNNGIGSYDAVIITEDNLIEASGSQYSDVYLNSNIPFFFISTKSHIPFTVKDAEYDNTWNWTAGNHYAVGVLTSKEDNSLKSWGYGLYNDEKTEDHIENLYSRIFETIHGIKH